MAGAVNKVILIGNLGKDPELRRTPSGAAVTSFSLATTERFTSRDGGRQEQTEWHEIVAWNKSAETMAQYLRKGSSVYIEGKLRTRSWEDNGQKRYKTEIVVSTFQFLDSKGSNGGGGFSSGGGASDFGEPPMGFDAPQQDSGFGAPQQDNSFGGGGGYQQQAPAQPQYQQPQQQQAPAQPQYQQQAPAQSAPPVQPAAPIQVDDDLPF